MPLLQIGIRYGWEMASGIGHVACTLAGVNFESKGSAGCIKGRAARGATNSLFRHHFYLPLTAAQVAAARQYADACVGRPYVWGGVPSAHHGGDCSGFVSGIICAAKGQTIRRLFGTDNWLDRQATLGFHPGLAPPAPTPSTIGDDMTPAEFLHILQDAHVADRMRALPWQYVGGGIPAGKSTLNVLDGLRSGVDMMASTPIEGRLRALEDKLDAVLAAIAAQSIK